MNAPVRPETVTTSKQSPIFGPFRRMPIYLVRRLDQICTGALAEAIDGVLTPLEWAVLTHVHFAPDIDQQMLVESAGIDRSHTSRIVDELEAKGLLRRSVSEEDRRTRLLSVTPQGAALRERLRVRAIASQNDLLAPLSRAERDVFFDLLGRVIEANARYARPGADRRNSRRSSKPSGAQRRRKS